jgi:hypothetical protein
MPASKKEKNETGTELFVPEENIMLSSVAFERRDEAWKVSIPFPLDPAEGRKHSPAAKPGSNRELDANFVLTYLVYDRLLEQALLRAVHIEKQFDPDGCRTENSGKPPAAAVTFSG